ncbi:ADP-ribosylglycohydrolase family protein [Stackebrandtia nassauensis]|uniref:ADP-ribosylation/Crystallin J1 n=1 Tax=Stackebrandtia nassauensis (strain DSM 44728 / CIP 108903 / NRRL B-16338 / NBRC 102104 / LLR-40K-21) TaxID=446470 RepID=D3Q3E3_STANL|nr:ADP-ribosylglycohydrolase family protein [Stackebrandtia nassauensis]ADD41984.1 ADP-ribosylation/Crystallin J1 [Stackebrandtia nassauensis DSM 44728]
MMRLSWTQPEDLVPHALVAAELDGRDTTEIRQRWRDGGGAAEPAVSGATPDPAPEHVRTLARELLSEIDKLPDPEVLRTNEPDDIDDILATTSSSDPPKPGPDFDDRVLGAWLGRASGCLLGKPVEKLPLAGIRAIGRATGNWPLRSYFTEVGLDATTAAKYPWNRRSRPTSLVENIDGMPEDDDLNFPLIALDLLERTGFGFSTEDVAQSWLSHLPGGRVFTAERITYRNLLDGYEPDVAGRVRNPFRDWIGAQIRTDVYGWTNPGQPQRAARLAWTDARLSHGRNGVYGAMFAAAASAAAVTAVPVTEVLETGLSVVPPASRYAAAVRRGTQLGLGDLPDDAAIDVLHEEYGHLHWVHVLNNAALLAFALARGDGDFARTITLAVSGGWDTDSVGATAGAITGALTGAKNLPPRWIDPLDDRLATTVPGFAGARFSNLAARTVAIAR